MTSNIVLPQLGPWAENHIKAIVQATNQQDFDAAFDNFFAKDVEVTFNGARISRDEYKKNLSGEAFIESGAVVTFSGLVAVPAKDGDTTNPYIGEAGLFYTAIIAEGIVIHDAPVERKVTSSINITAKEDPSLHAPTGPIHGFFDGRRVFKVNQVFTDGPNTSS